jgi:hypothetical protein
MTQVTKFEANIGDKLEAEIRELLEVHGATLKFAHPGIFRESKENGSSAYITEIFGRFSSDKCDLYNRSGEVLLIEHSLLGLAKDILEAMPSNIVNTPIKENAGLAIVQATRACENYLPHVTSQINTPHLRR